MGLFPRTVWVALLAAAGFEPLEVPLETPSVGNAGTKVFLGLRPLASERVQTVRAPSRGARLEQVSAQTHD